MPDVKLSWPAAVVTLAAQGWTPEQIQAVMPAVPRIPSSDWDALWPLWPHDAAGFAWLTSSEILALATQHGLKLVHGHGRAAFTAAGKTLRAWVANARLEERNVRNGRVYRPVVQE